MSDPKDTIIESLTTQVEQLRAQLFSARATEDELREQLDALRVQTINPDYDGPIGPGEIADPSAYMEALASGELREWRKPSPEIDAQQEHPAAQLRAAIGTLGLPKHWERSLRAAMPGVALAARERAQAGGDLRREELLSLAQRAAERVYTGILETFAADVQA